VGGAGVAPCGITLAPNSSTYLRVEVAATTLLAQVRVRLTA
jgi:hypothetical protein